jgi:hypothetical protein
MPSQSLLALDSVQAPDRLLVDKEWAPLKTTIVFDSYWKLAAERQRIFFARFRNNSSPWTDDRILRVHKFTNAYRASDRVSQHLIRKIIYEGDQSPKEIFFRTVLFKFFNRIETWQLLIENVRSVNSKDYRFSEYDRILNEAMLKNKRIYSAAYIMPSGGRNSPHKRKHQMHLKLLEKMMVDKLYDRLAECDSMREAFALLKGYPTIGDFLAYQYVTDLNYSSFLRLSEMEFTCAGPGAKSGIAKCFENSAGLTDADIIKLMCERQEHEFSRLGIAFQDLWGRRLQLIDCQNLFCEVDKYSRVAHPNAPGGSGRTRIKQKFHPKREKLDLWYPPKWGLNEKIELERHDNSP